MCCQIDEDGGDSVQRNAIKKVEASLTKALNLDADKATAESLAGLPEVIAEVSFLSQLLDETEDDSDAGDEGDDDASEQSEDDSDGEQD
jgi:hypothetical protein